jgi:hypothetical protein
MTWHVVSAIGTTHEVDLKAICKASMASSITLLKLKG